MPLKVHSPYSLGKPSHIPATFTITDSYASVTSVISIGLNNVLLFDKIFFYTIYGLYLFFINQFTLYPPSTTNTSPVT